MQREILFRGKTVNGEWVYGNYAHIKKDFSTVKKGHYISNSIGSPFAFLVRPETVGQFTGLTDKNGNKIFEGDIAKPLGNIYNRQRYLIKWDNPTARFLFFRYIDDDITKGIQSVGYHYTYTKLVNDLEIEIIGNIYN